ncbi:DUF3068 domain-containing protein [Phycicoccus flavus]|uniref:DUF3068 domain-containing protein n=1 Tax=Phycicoccus flavus TaxID=2502783 RepID=A0A8T6QZY7_9MICO|nr:DUF3068 domain-containing protein [Phycicoccus flavus]NHA67247.1 DUF3068 domain-containing protein [Phycicoccus flavus]
MRKATGLVLLGLFGFLLVTAALTWLYVPGQLKKTPLDVDSTTRLAGQGTYLDEPEGPVAATSHSVADPANSDGSTVVFDTFTCVLRNPAGDVPDCLSGKDERTIILSSDRFATDRVTGLAVDAPKADLARPHEGLVNKWPFDPEKRTYAYWDGLLGRAVEATFEDEESVDGVATYRYHVAVDDQPAEITKGIQGNYSTDKTLWVDRTTGAIIDQQEHQVRSLPDGGTALDMRLGFTQDTVAANVASAKETNTQLGLLRIAPLVLLVLALLALAGGVALVRSTAGAPARRRRPQPKTVSLDEMRQGRSA